MLDLKIWKRQLSYIKAKYICIQLYKFRALDRESRNLATRIQTTSGILFLE